jgi:hypothetical protein
MGIVRNLTTWGIDMTISRRKAIALFGGGTILAATAGMGAFLGTRTAHSALAPWTMAGGYDDPRLNALSLDCWPQTRIICSRGLSRLRAKTPSPCATMLRAACPTPIRLTVKSPSVLAAFWNKPASQRRLMAMTLRLIFTQKDPMAPSPARHLQKGATPIPWPRTS